MNSTILHWSTLVKEFGISSMLLEVVGITFWDNEIAEEVEEEKMQPETDLHAPVEIPLRTQEMDQAKEVEEKIWKEENLMTDRDLEIASKDIPERMQLMGGRILEDRLIQRYAYS